ncbi:MAG: sigma-70 family RNA polymerase sigma factor [Clostridiales bacterium]|nr:sigma-70 family RNA polymerase sigma factor [Clostridiales bacterium]
MEFEQIYRTYFKPVYLYILKLSGNEHIAEEITSETFLKAMKSIGDFRGECDMRVWLCQIAKNAYYSYLKRSNRIVNVDEAELQNVADSNVSVEEQLGIREEVQQIRKVLHTMSNPYKEVFMWRVFGELSFKEIGALYGKTDNWACVTYHRARKMIQSRLEEINNEKRV